MFNHPTVSSSLLSTAASIGFFGVGSAYTLYQLCFGGGGGGTERNKKTSQTTYPPPPPLHPDNLYRILAHLPLGERLQTSRQVNSEWAEVVAGQFRRQKILALRIGTGQSEERWADLKNYYQFKPQYIPPQHVHPFQSMAVEVLTGETAAVLVSAFPHLQTLTVVLLLTDEQQNLNENIQNTFSNLSTLISAFASTLTTLQLVFIVEKTAFQTHFPSLFESFSSLTRLKHFTLMDFDLKLTLPASFNLKEFLPNSLETLKLHFSHCSVPELHQSLQRYLRNTQKEGNPLKVDLVLGSYARRSASLAALAAHLHALYLIAYSAEDLMLFCSRFTALRQLLCWTFRLPSLAGTVAQLARLPHLTHLFLYEADGERNANDNVVAANAVAAAADNAENNAQIQAAVEANIEANLEVFAAEAVAFQQQQRPPPPSPPPPARNAPPPPPPSLSSLKHLQLSIKKATVDHAYLGQLLHPTVLPAVQRVVLFLYPSPTVRCADCGWTLRKLPDPQHMSEQAAAASDQLRQFEAALRRCLSKVAAPFAFAAPTTATKPSFFSAYTIVTPCQYFVCHILAEDWPEVKVKKALSIAEAAGAAGEAEDNEKVENVQIPDRCFQLVNL